MCFYITYKVTVVDFLLWNISLEGPAVVNQHTEAPLALVSLFHVRNVLMKSLSVLVTDGAKILREEV
jgi:hypothetical protein